MIADNKRSITLQPHNVGVLLSEIVRAYLHQGNPSVLIQHIAEGVDKYRQEVPLRVLGVVQQDRQEEHRLLGELLHTLRGLRDEWRRKEETFG